ncbi:MAG: hypothetical protein ACRDO7_01790 [Nocardioidaceae bacterium]
MRDIERGHTRPMSRDLGELPQRPGIRRLHVDRPCYVHREGHGRWSWQCSVCPLPLCLASVEADSWQQAVADADRHIRTMHATVSATGAPADAEVPVWELAA